MKKKKTQSTMIVMATALGMSGILQPLAVQAQEDVVKDDLIPNEQSEINKEKQQAPAIDLPQNLVGDEGQSLRDIVLPENWSWVDNAMLLTQEETKYSARIFVDDENYDYSEIAGYDAAGHYVECTLTITVLKHEPVITGIDYNSEVNTSVHEENTNVLSTTATGNIVINDAFEDAEFRAFLNKSFSKQTKDGILTKAEISAIKNINFNRYPSKANIKSLAGIEHLTALTTLNCSGSGIQSLDLSHNTMLTSLNVSKTGLKDLNINNTALTYLNCSNTNIENLDVRMFKDLTYLDCSNTKLQTLDVSNNTALTTLSYASTAIGNLNIESNINLSVLVCSNTGTTSLDIQNQPELTFLDCSDNVNLTVLNISKAKKLVNLFVNNTGLKEIDIQGADKLMYLYCMRNQYLTTLILGETQVLDTIRCNECPNLISIDVSGIKNLRVLECQKSGLQAIDVSKNEALQTLECTGSKNLSTLKLAGAKELFQLYISDTNISSLDLSQNKKMSYLSFKNTPLVWLNIDNTNDFLYFEGTLAELNTMVTADSHDITKLLPGIDISNIKIRGGRLEGNIIKDYKPGVPIVYEYNTGATYKGQPIITTGTIIFEKGDSAIKITEPLDKEYTGKPYENPSVDTGNSMGKVSFDYYGFDEYKNPVLLNEAPTDAGKYAIHIELAEDDYYNGSTIELEEFEIMQVSNAWNKEPFIEGWTYGEQPKDAIADAKFGNVDITYSNSKTGIYTDQVPTDAGTWYMKASVEGTNNYTGLTYIGEFMIHQAKNVWDKEPSIEGWTYGEQPKDAIAEARYGKVDITYSNSKTGIYTDTVPTDAGTWYMKASVEGTNNYTGLTYIGEFMIHQAKNVWDNGPSIENWTYGEQPKDAIAEAKFGKVDITYSNSKTGIYTDTVPTDAGTWYMKASVEGTNNYTGLSDVVSFVIQPKNATENPDIKIPDIKDDQDLEDLVIKDGENELEKGKDYEVDKQQKDEETIVTITFKDNYTGEVTKTYITKKEEQKETETPKEETKEEPKADLKADAIKKAGETHQGGRFGLWSTLLAGCGIVAMKKQKKEEKQ